MEFIVNSRENLVVVAEKNKPTTRQLVLTYEDGVWWFLDCVSKESVNSEVEDPGTLVTVLIAMNWGFITLSAFLELMHLMSVVMSNYDGVKTES